MPSGSDLAQPLNEEAPTKPSTIPWQIKAPGLALLGVGGLCGLLATMTTRSQGLSGLSKEAPASLQLRSGLMAVATGHAGGLAAERCQQASPIDASLEELLPLIATGRGQDPKAAARPYETPETRVYICHNPREGSPRGYLYMYGEEYAVQPASHKEAEQAEVLWDDLLIHLLDYSAPAHGHSHAEYGCENPQEFVFTVDERFNVIATPQWEKPEKSAADFSAAAKKLMLSSLGEAVAHGTPVSHHVLHKMELALGDRLAAAEGAFKEKCESTLQHPDAAWQHACKEAAACWKCFGGFFWNELSNGPDVGGWWWESKHGDCTPGDSPVQDATARVARTPRSLTGAASLFAGSFAEAGSASLASDVAAKGPFRAPARMGGEAIGCRPSTVGGPVRWWINDRSGYALHRVPLDVMRKQLRSYFGGRDLEDVPMDEMVSKMSEESPSGVPGGLLLHDMMPFCAKGHPEREISLEQFCQVGRLMRLPPDANMHLLANNVSFDFSACR
eukprot:TRINITY_DN30817_c0_g1_i1.p1 TRINITY_DN30817_c0_g1~~TRINITY_DN30817_c0_g1_i1.p1  ORF type:complete len:503 (-),score=87.58 TRINITY_DN30817_c0_g1_i1:175-1683(-)